MAASCNYTAAVNTQEILHTSEDMAMDVKLKTSEMLLRKLANGCSDVQMQAVIEMRLFAKYDDDNRASLARAGAIPVLLHLVRESLDPQLKDKAMIALLNISINAENKVKIIEQVGGLETVIRVACEGENAETRANAAALLYSLIVDDNVRTIVADMESLWAALLSLLRDGSAKCKAEALKALFVAASDEQIREHLLQEKLQTVSLLVAMATVGKVKLTEDCLAVLALLGSCLEGALAITNIPNAVQVFIYLLHRGSPRTQENAVSVLLNVCQNFDDAKAILPLKMLLPALHNLYLTGSERGKAKAGALMKLLGADELDDAFSSLLNHNPTFKHPVTASMPILGANINRHNATHHHHESNPYGKPPALTSSLISGDAAAASSSSDASMSKTFFNNRYINMARNLFSHKPRKRSHSSIPH